MRVASLGHAVFAATMVTAVRLTYRCSGRGEKPCAAELEYR